MSYLTVISLATAKNYLKIDSGQNQTDAEITSMINSACSYIEQRTGWLFYERGKIYYGSDYSIIYDHPINNAPAGTNKKALYSIVPTNNGEVTLNVGAITPNLIPEALLNCALQIVNFWFYNQETNGAENSIPNFVERTIDSFKRFV